MVNGEIAGRPPTPNRDKLRLNAVKFDALVRFIGWLENRQDLKINIDCADDNDPSLLDLTYEWLGVDPSKLRDEDLALGQWGRNLEKSQIGGK